MNFSGTIDRAIAQRRSLYELDNQIKLSEEEFREFIGLALQNAPSANNSQSTRLIVLTQEAHREHWQQVEKILAQRIPSEKFERTAKKLAKFRAAYATILFFEDLQVVKKLEEQYPLYAEKYLDWSHQANAMLQYAIWIGLEAKGLGVSIQHYNPLINTMVQTYWQAPKHWQLITEMVVGNPIAEASDKEVVPLESKINFIHQINEYRK